MKIGVLVASAIVILTVVLWIVLSGGRIDSSTSRSAADKLPAQTLPAGLPALYAGSGAASEGGGVADAEDVYVQLIKYAFQQGEAIDAALDAQESVENQVAMPAALRDELTELLTSATSAGEPAYGFLDQDVPWDVSRKPDYGDRLYVAAVAGLRVGDQYLRESAEGLAFEMYHAVHVLGRRLFEKNLRLVNRELGLQLMFQAQGRMNQTLDQVTSGESGIEQWNAAIDAIDTNWNAKKEVVLSREPHIGDLVKLAGQDEDRMFRVEATLQLALAKFNAKSKGNLREIERLIEVARHSDDEAMRAAGQYAHDLTLEQMKSIRAF